MSAERSREPVPDAARALAGDHLPTLSAYVDLLCTSGVERGLIGPRESTRVWSRHVVNCAVVTEGVPAGSRLVDVGSGAGLPGLVLAICRPDLTVVLVDSLLRRITWLTSVIGALGLQERVRAEHVRAEDAQSTITADVVTARAVAPLRTLVPWTVPFLHQGGIVLALKGESAEDDLRDADPVISRFPVEHRDIVHFGVGVVTPPTTVVRLRVGAVPPGPRARAGETMRPRRRGRTT